MKYEIFQVVDRQGTTESQVLNYKLVRALLVSQRLKQEEVVAVASQASVAAVEAIMEESVLDGQDKAQVVLVVHMEKEVVQEQKTGSVGMQET